MQPSIRPVISNLSSHAVSMLAFIRSPNLLLQPQISQHIGNGLRDLVAQMCLVAFARRHLLFDRREQTGQISVLTVEPRTGYRHENVVNSQEDLYSAFHSSMAQKFQGGAEMI